MKAVSSVYVAIFLVILAFGAVFGLLFAMSLQNVPYSAPEPHLLITYNETTQYLNITNTGPNPILITGFAVFQGKSFYIIPYTASLNSGQTAFVYLYNAIKPNETIAVLTNEGASEVTIK